MANYQYMMSADDVAQELNSANSRPETRQSQTALGQGYSRSNRK